MTKKQVGLLCFWGGAALIVTGVACGVAPIIPGISRYVPAIMKTWAPFETFVLCGAGMIPHTIGWDLRNKKPAP